MKGFSGVSSFFVAVVLCFLGGYGLGGGFSGGVDVVENDEVVSSERERRVGVGQELVFGVGGVERMCELVEGRGGVLRVLEVQVGVGGMGREELEELWALRCRG